MEHLEVVSDRGVMLVVLYRLERKNAITFDRHGALAESIRDAGRRGEVRAVVIHDSEEVFASGNEDASEATSSFGLCREFKSCQLPPNNVGTPKATELLPLAEPCSAQEQAECGLIDIPAGTALAHTMELLAIRPTRSLFRRSEDEEKLDPIDLKVPEFASRLRSADPKNALAAFFARHAPGFSLFS